MTKDFANKVLKVPVNQEAIRVEDPAEVARRRGAEAADVIHQARKTAERILADNFEAIRRERERVMKEIEQARSSFVDEREAIFEELHREASRKAQEEVHSEVKPRLEAAAEGFEKLIRRTEEILGEVLENHRNEVVDLALGIAEKIVGKIQAENEELVKHTATKCIRAARNRQEMVIRLHPDDVEVLKAFEVELIERFDDLKKVRLEEDRRVDRGGVWIETPSGFIDGRIRTQMEEVLTSVLPDEENPRTRPGEAGKADEEGMKEGPFDEK